MLVVLAAEQVGGAAACLDMAAEYAKIRHQFSRPIGSFQAIKHKLADLLLQVEMGRSALDRALLAEHDPQRLAEAAAVAKIWCSDAFVAAATENVHINGGTGFTWEHDAHLYLPSVARRRGALRRRLRTPRTAWPRCSAGDRRRRVSVPRELVVTPVSSSGVMLRSAR